MAISPTLSECFLMLSRKSLRSDMEISLISSLSLGRFSAIIWQNLYWPTLQVAQHKFSYVKIIQCSSKYFCKHYNFWKSRYKTNQFNQFTLVIIGFLFQTKLWKNVFPLPAVLWFICHNEMCNTEEKSEVLARPNHMTDFEFPLQLVLKVQIF